MRVFWGIVFATLVHPQTHTQSKHKANKTWMLGGSKVHKHDKHVKRLQDAFHANLGWGLSKNDRHRIHPQLHYFDCQ